MHRIKKKYCDPEFKIVYLSFEENVCASSFLDEEQTKPEDDGIDTPIDEWD